MLEKDERKQKEAGVDSIYKTTRFRTHSNDGINTLDYISRLKKQLLINVLDRKLWHLRNRLEKSIMTFNL